MQDSAVTVVVVMVAGAAVASGRPPGCGRHRVCVIETETPRHADGPLWSCRKPPRERVSVSGLCRRPLTVEYAAAPLGRTGAARARRSSHGVRGCRVVQRERYRDASTVSARRAYRRVPSAGCGTVRVWTCVCVCVAYRAVGRRRGRDAAPARTSSARPRAVERSAVCARTFRDLRCVWPSVGVSVCCL